MSCTACPLHQDAMSVCVKSRGFGKVLIVGANPGKEEDLSGEAWVGKYGKLLDAMLVDAGFDLDDVCRTYAVRCVTDKPMPQHLVACSPHLVEEIQRVKPEAIIALGEHAMKVLIGGGAISNYRGQSFPLRPEFGHACEVFVTYAPGFVTKTPTARSLVTSDLRRVRDRGLAQSEIEWEYFDDGHWPFKLGDELSFDIETYDENGKITKHMTQIAVSNGTRTIVSRNVQQAHYIVGLLRSAHNLTPIIAHNGWKFDDLKTGIASTYDTMALAYLDDETQPLGLESLCVKYLRVRGWKEDAAAPLGSDDLARYNARDALYTWRLFQHLKDVLGDRVRIIDHIIRPGRRALDAITRRGVWINHETVEKARAKYQAMLDERRERLLTLIYDAGFPRDKYDVQLKTKVKHVPLNPNSNKHLGDVLTWLGFKLPLTDQGEPQVTKQTLFYIDHPIARAVEDYREVAKLMSTYIMPFLKIAKKGDGRARTFYDVLRTLTGRSNSGRGNEATRVAMFGDDDPLARNLQNLARDFKDFKDAPPGKVLTSADYSAVEFRMGAFIADERVIIENYAKNKDWDPHTYFATILYNESEEAIIADSKAAKADGRGDSKRQIAKSGNFSQEYLGVGATLKAYAAREMGIDLTDAQADHIHKTWHKVFPGWVPWYGRVKTDLIERGFTESPTGRRRNYGDFSLLVYSQRIAALRELCNAMVQGFCADIALIALGACHAAGLPIVDFVHDDIKFEFDSEEQAKQAEPLIRKCMIDEPLRVLRDVFGVVPTVPLEIEIIHQISSLPYVKQVA